MARLENGSYDEIVDHLGRELELVDPEESDELPIATRTSSNSQPNHLLSNEPADRHRLQLLHKERGQTIKDSDKLKNKKERMPKIAN